MKPKLIDLRNRLAARLARQIRNPAVEAKELHAFDLMISRRLFMKGVGLGTLATLVNSALPPTAWGKAADACKSVKPSDVGLTPGEMATVTQASGIDFGTELFQDTIYSQPAVALNQQNMHCLIEGPRARMRVQSQLDDQSPLEENFFDTGFHFGPSELIQLEKDSNGHWELVHYFHPWNVRKDGGHADGLTRHVIFKAPLILTKPTRIFCITGSHTNEFVNHFGDTLAGATYLVYIEQANGHDGGFIAIGQTLSTVRSGIVKNELEYPIVWGVSSTGDLNLPNGTSNYQFADKYVNAGLDLAVPGGYVPDQATEHIIIYLNTHIKIISLDDVTTPGTGILIVTTVPFPDGVADTPRIAHIEYTPTAGATSDYLQISDYTLLSTQGPDADTLYCYTNQWRNATNSGYKTALPASGFSEVPVRHLSVGYKSTDYGFTARQHAGDAQNDHTDIASLENVNGLASTVVNWGGVPFTQTMHLKIGNYPGTGSTSNRGLTLFALSRQVGDDNGKDPDLVLYAYEGDFPLAVPDDAGIGTITGISGGSSKFGGLRLFASDDIGNLFMLRQQRLPDSTTPYTPPIYIQNDAEGDPATFSSTKLMPVPSSTAAGSNLQGFHNWMAYFYSGASASELDPNQVVAYNFLLNGLLGFGTDATNVAQATWLGSGAQAVYAPKRFSHDAEHMVVREVSDDGATSQFNVFNVFNNIVEKTWVSRKIASQVEPDAPGLQESGDFYQATVYATNIYGDQVALNDTTNPGMMVEIRGDAPATVIDLTNNKYYDVDRYTSFVALPDQTSNQLRLSVKAENFSQILYVRLLQTDELSPSSSDSAMLTADTSAVGTATDWVAINIAADGQARMAATSTTSSTTGLTSGSCGSGCADSVYICTDSLCQSNTNNNWQTKGGYSPSTGNLDSLSSYMNQSGQNLSDASANVTALALGATQTDPLTSTTPLTADANRTPLQTTFDYKGGTISVGPPSTQSVALPGSVFSSVNHALHDAFHWLQHVEGKLYSSLANGVDVVIDDTENISVSIAADIMKQVNGIDEDLNEVVSTVEEYGSIVVNVVVTIVESSFIYRFVELLIALISLFIYLEDIKSLSNSLKSLIKELSDPNSPYAFPVDPLYPWEEKLSGYVGTPNNVDDAMSLSNTDEVVDEVVDGLLNTVLKNPFTRKLVDEVVSALSRAISDLDTTSPVQFNIDTSIVDSQVQLLEDFASDIDALVVNVTDDTINFMVNQVVDDVENPRQTYTNFKDGLSQLMAEVEADAMDAAYNLLGQLVAAGTTVINEIMEQSDFVELKIPLLADLFKLFGIGSVSGSKVTLGSGNAISFPLALVIWSAIFEATGKSIKNINELIPGTSALPGDSLPGASTENKLAFANAVVAADLMAINGLVWTALQTASPADRQTATFKTLNLAGDWVLLARWLMAMTTYGIQRGTGQANTAWENDYKPAFEFSRLVTTMSGLTMKYKGTTVDLRVMPLINSLINLTAIVWSAVDAAEAEVDKPSGSDWALLVGDDVGRGAVFVKLGYALLTGDNPPSGSDYLPIFGASVVGMTGGGFGAAAAATGIEKNVGATAPTSGCLQPSPHAINQLIGQVDALNIRLPKKAQCKQETRLTRYLLQAQQAYAQGSMQEGASYLVKFGHTIESMKQGRRIAAADADLLITKIQDLLVCQG